MKAGNIISFGGKRSGDQGVTLREGYHGTINACRQLLVKFLPQRMDALFERLDDVLYTHADKAGNDKSQAAYFEAMRILRREREQIQSAFNKGVLGRFDRFWTHGPGSVPNDAPDASFTSDELGLVESDDLEEGLAITGMVSKGNNSFYRDLYALDERFSYLLNGTPIGEAGNPLAPASFGAAFKQSMATLEVTLAVKLVIYKQFEKEVIGQLAPLYDQINATLAKAGIQPEIKPTVRRNSPYRASGSAGYGAAAEGAAYAPGEDPGLQAEVFATLQQLLMQRRPATQSVSTSVQYVDSMNLLSALSVLQHQGDRVAAAAGQALDAGAMRNALLSMPQIGQAASGKVAIGRSDDDTIDVISMLFEFILDDPGLSDAMRALLARLQIPMLKVAILDKSFFSRKDHPARRLLNAMAQAAIGWTEESGRSGDGLYAHIESAVGRILTKFDDDLTLFDELYEQFAAFLEREQRGAHVAEERAAQVTQGKEALVEAKRHVADEIGHCLSNYGAVPDVVQNLVRDGWNDVLLLIYLRKGRESEEWTDAVNLMDRLVWSVMPKPSHSERQELLRSIPELLKALRAGLAGISYNQHKMTRAFKGLQARHLACLRGGRALESADTDQADEDSQVDGAGDVMEEIVLESVDARSAPIESEPDQFDAQARELEVGTWLELTEEDGTVVRAKLSWRSNISGSCLFVNRKGMKVAEVTQQGLGVWLRSGKAVVLPAVSVPLMDRALNSMLATLNRSASTPPGGKKEE
ncbi:DUF1631 domain-containing protein [Sedimenticola sp.]|uniref:DUF1631 domain-containing protein n=1 Tax=Sedimenticola sp. TaxID=1940285 RepID=UPI00258B876F|nr:DUF1631 domain-containing protein [Sedimenticola sp.]MCW8905263.1 DUF1631 domain-containing protein [Sedimenticola sp.]